MSLNETDWKTFFEAGTYHNIIQDRMLSLAGQLLKLSDDAMLRQELHKAGLVHLKDTVHWWKACPSDRNNSVLMADTSTRLGHSYLGGCPLCPQSFEIVVIALDAKLAALLAVLPDMLRQHVPFVAPEEELQPAKLEEPSVHCDLWEDDLDERQAVVSELKEHMRLSLIHI